MATEEQNNSANNSVPLDKAGLGESQLRLSAFLKATSDSIYRMSPDWAVMYMLDGKGFISDTGIPLENWMDKYLYPADKQLVQAVIDNAVQNKSIFELEHRVLQADGTLGWVSSRAVPLLDEQGNITEWFGTASDITLRKQTETSLQNSREALEDSKRQYEAMTNATPDLVYIFSLEYTFLYANRALLEMWGRTEAEAIGQGLRPLGYEEWHAAMHEREIDEVRATQKAVRGTVSFPHAVLGKRIYDYILTPLLNEKSEVYAVAGTTRDISDLKTAEEALKQSEEQYRALNQSLEGIVKERTRELQQSNNDLQQFAHVASHDLKEPLRKVRTFASRLEKELAPTLSVQGRQYLDKIYSATDRMNNMIEGVLAYATVGNTKQANTQVNLNRIIKDIEADLEVAIEQKGATITYSQLPAIEGSDMLLYQLFYNLVNNSLKFVRPGQPPVISISAANYTENNKEYVRIQVQDNGIGFSQQQAERIFNTFTRLNSKDQYEGTGLGLALCKKIVERHSGTIQATSAEGEGALFTVELPVRQG